MKKTLLTLLSVSAAVVALSACAPAVQCDSVTMQVERVFWHEHVRYSFVVKNADGSLETVTPSIGNYNLPATVKLHTGVPPDEPMRVELSQCVKSEQDSKWVYYGKADIYLHAIEDMNGGDWNHGKHGRGSTVPIGR